MQFQKESQPPKNTLDRLLDTGRNATYARGGAEKDRIKTAELLHSHMDDHLAARAVASLRKPRFLEILVVTRRVRRIV